MGNLFDKEAASCLLNNLKKEYDIFAPKRYPGDGAYSDTDTIRYGIIESFEEIIWDRKSDYSFKEALLPISDTNRHGHPIFERHKAVSGTFKDAACGIIVQ